MKAAGGLALAVLLLAACAAAPRSPEQARLDACLAKADRNIITSAQDRLLERPAERLLRSSGTSAERLTKREHWLHGSTAHDNHAGPGGEPMADCPMCFKPLSMGTSIVYKGDQLIHAGCWSRVVSKKSASTVAAEQGDEERDRGTA
jgi:hypothetical protein